MRAVFQILMVMFACFTMGCAIFESPYAKSGAIGGASGALVGAGSGALIGAVIANGDIAASATLGAAIGLPAGILLGVAYQYYTEETELDENNSEIVQNYQYIVERQRQINELREEIAIDYQTIRVDRRARDQIYVGPTIGVSH